MMIRFATEDEIAIWDELIVANPDGGNMFASRELAETKRTGGWRPRYLIVDDVAVTVHERRVPLLGRLWYVPKGPGVISVDHLHRVVEQLAKFGRKHGAFLLKIEPELPRDLRRDLPASWRLSRPIQPNASTIILDLMPSLDDIMIGLHQKSRHAIRRAERDGVTAVPVDLTEANARTMYDLLAGTAQAQGFRIRSFSYHYGFWQRFVEAGHGQLFFAYYDGQVVAAAFATNLGRKGTYKDGASIRERTAYGASHLLQWEIIRWMKPHGVTRYDLCGTPPSDQMHDESHPHYNIGRFKSSFSKSVTDYIGVYDIPLRFLACSLWSRIGEWLLLRIYSRLRGENWY